MQGHVSERLASGVWRLASGVWRLALDASTMLPVPGDSVQIGLLHPALDQGHGALHAVFQANARFAASSGDAPVRLTALGAYLVMRLVARTLETAGNADPALELQRRSTVQFVDDLPTTVAECAHLRFVLAALSGEAEELVPLRRALLRYAGWLEREGRLDMALEALRLAARTWDADIPPRDFTALALEVGRVNRQLDRLRLASDAYRAASSAALCTGDRLAQLRALLGDISVRRLEGRTSGLEQELRALLGECRDDPALVSLVPLVHADLGALSSAAGRPDDAVRAMVQATRAARSVPERLQMLAGLGRILLELGVRDLAAAVLEHVAARSPDRLVRAGAEVELMDIAARDGNRLGFERLRAGLARLIWRLPATMRAEFHYRAGLGFFRFSQLARARRSWSAGRTLAIRQGLEQWAEHFRRLQDSEDEQMRLTTSGDSHSWTGREALLHEVRSLLHPSPRSAMPEVELV
jgi:tetratricopeptide (TPR) repeat protein